MERIQKIYNYAEWCSKQKEQMLWNAAGVSFYEHLGDNELVFSQFTTWVKKHVYFDHRDMLSARFDNDKMKQLDRFYGWSPPKRK